MRDAHAHADGGGGAYHLPVAVATRAPQHFASAISSSVHAEVNVNT